MKFIVIRHGKTTNNYWQEISYEDYIKNRNQDPDLCEEVKEQCEFVGNFLKSNKIRINKFLCSCQRRAIKTLNYISNVYDKSVPKECIPSLHEYKGIYLNDKVYPGMTEKEIKELCPDIKLPENMDLSKGWYDKDHKETEEEFKKRIKEVINMFKEMAQNCEDENYTVCFISHNDFLNGFFSMLNNASFVVNNQLNISHDNLCLSSFVIDKNRKVTINYINFDPKI
jgi:broad specificity phosphatase PhoE